MFDLDDTLLDFSKAEYNGIKQVMEKYDLDFSEQLYQEYHEINKKYWHMFENGLIDNEQVLSLRFEEFFNNHHIKVDGSQVDHLYRSYLNNSAYTIAGAINLLNALKDDYDIYAATNGVYQTQCSRLDKAKMNDYFKKIFISEQIGYKKPDTQFFDYCFEQISDFDKSKTLMIGDSITSDIKGGYLAGIDTCWYNPHKDLNQLEIQPTYEVENYEQLYAILENK